MPTTPAAALAAAPSFRSLHRSLARSVTEAGFAFREIALAFQPSPGFRKSAARKLRRDRRRAFHRLNCPGPLAIDGAGYTRRRRSR